MYQTIKLCRHLVTLITKKRVRSFQGQEFDLLNLLFTGRLVWWNWREENAVISSKSSPFLFCFPNKEVCQATDIIMCPVCDKYCPFMRLSDSCVYAKVIPNILYFSQIKFNISSWETVVTTFFLSILIFDSQVYFVGEVYLYHLVL